MYLNVDEVESALEVATGDPFTGFTELIPLPNLTWENFQCNAIKIGNGTNPGCLPQSQNLGCADIATLNFPRVTRTSTCGTSRRTAALNESWGVCTDD